ncbi:Unknown protein, partial [Striga hermonthica]
VESTSWSILGSGYKYFGHALFKSRKSIHIRHFPSDFETITVFESHSGNWISFTWPAIKSFSTSASITLSISAPWFLLFCFTGLTVRSMFKRCSITSALMPVNSSSEYANTSAKSLITLMSFDLTGSSNSFPIRNFLSSHPSTICISSTSPPPAAFLHSLSPSP